MTRRWWLLTILLLAAACSASHSAGTAHTTVTVGTTESVATTATSADVVVAVAFDVADDGVVVTATLHNNSGTTFEIPYMWELQRAEGDGWSTVGYLPWVGVVAATPPEMCLDQHTCEVVPSVKLVDAGETVQLAAHLATLPNGTYRVVAPDLTQLSQSDVSAQFAA